MLIHVDRQQLPAAKPGSPLYVSIILSFVPSGLSRPERKDRVNGVEWILGSSTAVCDPALESVQIDINGRSRAKQYLLRFPRLELPDNEH